MAILTSTARLLLRTLESIATPCSVKARGEYRRPPQLEVPKWNLKFSNSSTSNLNIKSSGKRFILRLTARFSAFVSTPYKSAKSLSNITLCPLINRMLLCILSTGIFMSVLFGILDGSAIHRYLVVTACDRLSLVPSMVKALFAAFLGFFVYDGVFAYIQAEPGDQGFEIVQVRARRRMEVILRYT